MSAVAAGGRAAPVSDPRTPLLAAGRRVAPAAPVLAFAALALLAAARFAALLAHPPVWAALGIVAAATATAAALFASGGLVPRSGLATAARVTVLAVAASLAGAAAGAGAGWLWPSRWGDLAGTISAGLNAYDGRWPYHALDGTPRVTLMLAVAVALLAAAALAFWPGRGARLRGAASLGLLLTLYTTAAVNETTAGWRLQGLLVAAAAWLWVWAWWRPAAGSAGGAAAWVAIACVAALIAAGTLRSAAPLVDYRSWNPFGPAYPPAVFDWNQQYGPLDPQRSDELMLEVHSTAPHLWRVTTLDGFDGVAFVRTANAGRVGAAVTTTSSAYIVSARVTVAGLRSAELAAPGPVVSVRLLAGAGRPGAIEADGTAALAGALAGGDGYDVRALAVDAGPAALRRAPRAFAPVYLPYASFALPGAGGRVAPPAPGRSPAADPALIRRVAASPYASVFALARSLGAGAPSAYDVVARVVRYLDGHEIYSLQPPRSTYPIVSFLERTHVGYCQQFSGAMALLLRMNGIPARVVAGFQPGTRTGPDTWRVIGADAHEWVEVYFAGIGWVTFDPTPGTTTGPLPLEPALAARTLLAREGARVPARSAIRRRDIGAPARPRSAHRAAARTLLPLAAATLAALLLAGALALAGGWALAIRRRRALDTAITSDVATAELAAAVAIVGPALAPGTTLSQLEGRLGSRYGRVVSEYAALLRAQRFGRGAGRLERPGSADRRRLRRALGAGHGPLTRIRLWLALPPGFVAAAAERRGAARAAATRPSSR